MDKEVFKIHRHGVDCSDKFSEAETTCVQKSVFLPSLVVQQEKTVHRRNQEPRMQGEDRFQNEIHQSKHDQERSFSEGGFEHDNLYRFFALA